MIVLLKYQASIILGPDPKGSYAVLYLEQWKGRKSAHKEFFAELLSSACDYIFVTSSDLRCLHPVKSTCKALWRWACFFHIANKTLSLRHNASSLLTLATSGMIRCPPPTAVKLPNHYFLQACLETDDCIGYNYNKIERSCEIVLYVTNKMPTSVNESGWELWLKSKPSSWYICML